MKPVKGEGLYNLVVIGAGPAGLVTAAGAAGLGARVALIERGEMGGDCLNHGCVPSKALLSSSRLAQRMREAGRWGLDSVEPGVALEKVFGRIHTLRASLAPNDSQERFESMGVDVFRGEGRFLGPEAVTVGGVNLRARNIVVATGSRPGIPDLPGLGRVPFFTNETIFDRLERLPRSLLVIGGGPQGCELGQAFLRLGVKVVLAQRPDRLLPREDPDVSELIKTVLQREGARVVLGGRIQRVEPTREGIRVEFETGLEESGGRISAPAMVDAVLVAAGRRPNLETLGLEAAGVAYDAHGIRVNACLQTSSPRIFAAGDATGPFLFTHTADAQARVVIRNTLLPWKLLWQKVDYTNVPWCTYTSPEVARVGMNETEAAKQGVAYDLHKISMSEVDRAVVDGETSGFAKVLVRKGGDRILGVTLVCEHAGDLLAEFVLAMKHGLGLKALASTVHAYPTNSEIVRKLGDRHNRTRLTPTARAVFGWLYARARSS